MVTLFFQHIEDFFSTHRLDRLCSETKTAGDCFSKKKLEQVTYLGGR